MIRRAVEVAVAAVLVVASLSHVSCDRMRVSLGVVTPATLASAPSQARSGSKRQAIIRAHAAWLLLVGFERRSRAALQAIYVALPPDADPKSVRIVPGSYSTTALPGSYDIAPVPAAATSDGETHWGTGKNVVWRAATRAPTADNAFYPSRQVRLVTVGNLRTWKVAVLEFWPYAYNPANGQLRMIESDEAQLSFSPEACTHDPAGRHVAAAMSGFVENREEASVGMLPSAMAFGGGLRDHHHRRHCICQQDAWRFRGFPAQSRLRGHRSPPRTTGAAGPAMSRRSTFGLGSRPTTLPLGLQYVLLIGNPESDDGRCADEDAMAAEVEHILQGGPIGLLLLRPYRQLGPRWRRIRRRGTR